MYWLTVLLIVFGYRIDISYHILRTCFCPPPSPVSHLRVLYLWHWTKGFDASKDRNRRIDFFLFIGIVSETIPTAMFDVRYPISNISTTSCKLKLPDESSVICMMTYKVHSLTLPPRLAYSAWWSSHVFHGLALLYQVCAAHCTRRQLPGIYLNISVYY